MEILRVAAGDGRLTATELDERLEAALTARTNRELVALTADLPEVATATKEVVRLNYRGGSTTRSGRWIVPRRMEILATGGVMNLDFTDAVITRPALEIQVDLRGGRLVLVTRPDIEVDLDDVVVRGGRVKVPPARGPQASARLIVKIFGQVDGGEVVVRPPRRTFWQWALHQPRR